MTTKPKSTLASIFGRGGESREPSGNAPKPLTALAVSRPWSLSSARPVNRTLRRQSGLTFRPS